MKNPFQPLQAQRTSDRVVDAIGKTIVDGTFGPGEALPPERTLAQRFGVNRSTVREALRALEQARLVTVRQGSRVRVLDYLANAGLEFLTVLLGTSTATQRALVHDLSEARAVIGEAICFYAVENLERGAIPAVSEAIEAFATEAGRHEPDLRKLQELDFEVQNRLIRGGGNQALILLHNSLRHVYLRIGHLFAPLMRDSRTLAGHYRMLAAALDAGELDAAKGALIEVFEAGRQAMGSAKPSARRVAPGKAPGKRQGKQVRRRHRHEHR